MMLIEITSSLTLYTENPGGDWLTDQRVACRKAGKNSHGAPKNFGPQTARFSRPVLVELSRLFSLSGVKGNHEAEGLSTTKEHMGAANTLPKKSDGTLIYPTILVDFEGEGWVENGLAAIKIANSLGWKYLPVNVRYYTGGEKISGDLSPNRLKKRDSSALDSHYSPFSNFQGILKGKNND